MATYDQSGNPVPDAPASADNLPDVTVTARPIAAGSIADLLRSVPLGLLVAAALLWLLARED